MYMWYGWMHFSGNQDIFFTKSTDSGNSFGKIINLSAAITMKIQIISMR